MCMLRENSIAFCFMRLLILVVRCFNVKYSPSARTIRESGSGHARWKRIRRGTNSEDDPWTRGVESWGWDRGDREEEVEGNEKRGQTTGD